jgi:hypothetical protein
MDKYCCYSQINLFKKQPPQYGARLATAAFSLPVYSFFKGLSSPFVG